jgi:hypothetical protein
MSQSGHRWRLITSADALAATSAIWTELFYDLFYGPHSFCFCGVYLSVLTSAICVGDFDFRDRCHVSTDIFCAGDDCQPSNLSRRQLASHHAALISRNKLISLVSIAIFAYLKRGLA